MKTLSRNHWNLKEYKERMTAKEWKEILLNSGDQIWYCGDLIQLKAKRLGAGVVEVYKAGSVVK